MKEPMLCARTTLDDLVDCLRRTRLIATPKLDGFRCWVVDKRALTRKCKPYPNTYIRQYLSRRSLNGLDGELVIGNGRGQFHDNTAGLARTDGQPNFRFYIFDLHNASTDYMQRLKQLPEFEEDRIKVLPYTVITSREELLEFEEKCLDAGYEGIVLRHPRGRYKFGRSTISEMGMMKLKRMQDSEAIIRAAHPMQSNTNAATRDERGRTKRSSAKAGMVELDTLGTFDCYDPTYKWEFSVGMGPGLTAKERDRLWKMRDRLTGKQLKYSFFPPGTKDRPRHPKYHGLRPKWD